MNTIQFGSNFKLNIHPTQFEAPTISSEEHKQIAEQVLNELKSKAPGSWGRVSDNGTELDFVCLDQYDFSTTQARVAGFKINNAFIFPTAKEDPISIPDQDTFHKVVTSFSTPQ